MNIEIPMGGYCSITTQELRRMKEENELLHSLVEALCEDLFVRADAVVEFEEAQARIAENIKKLGETVFEVRPSNRED